MPLCPVCGSEFEGRGKYCSPACKQKQHRATVKASKSAEAVAYLRFCPLVETILRHAVRSGTVAIIAGVNLADLNSLVNHHRFKCWETGTLLHLSHYTSANDRGSLHPENLGVWPGWLNQKLGKRSLNIGHHVSDRDWHNSSFFCSTEDDAYRILQRHFGKQLQSIALSGNLRRPKRLDQFLSLKRRGFKGSFPYVHKMSQADFEKLLRKFGLTVKAAAEPDDETASAQRTATRQLLHSELIRQARLYPQTRDAAQPFLHHLTDYPDDIATDVLALAVIHQYDEARRLMNSYDPDTDNHQPCDENLPYAVETVRWRDTEGHWNTTEIPHPDFYKYNPMEF